MRQKELYKYNSVQSWHGIPCKLVFHQYCRKKEGLNVYFFLFYLLFLHHFYRNLQDIWKHVFSDFDKIVPKLHFKELIKDSIILQNHS